MRFSLSCPADPTGTQIAFCIGPCIFILIRIPGNRPSAVADGRPVDRNHSTNKPRGSWTSLAEPA
jgi:hypothetical protein